MAASAIANSPMKSVETAEGAMPAFCMRLPLHQRGKIQEESMYYEHKKHDGSYPIIGVNSFRNPHSGDVPQKIELIRSTEEEKQSQLKRLRDFKARHKDESGPMLLRLQQAVIDNQNVFEVLVDAVRCCSLGQITNALFEVGGQYRRSM